MFSVSIVIAIIICIFVVSIVSVVSIIIIIVIAVVVKGVLRSRSRSRFRIGVGYDRHHAQTETDQCYSVHPLCHGWGQPGGRSTQVTAMMREIQLCLDISGAGSSSTAVSFLAPSGDSLKIKHSASCS